MVCDCFRELVMDPHIGGVPAPHREISRHVSHRIPHPQSPSYFLHDIQYHPRHRFLTTIPPLHLILKMILILFSKFLRHHSCCHRSSYHLHSPPSAELIGLIVSYSRVWRYVSISPSGLFFPQSEVDVSSYIAPFNSIYIMFLSIYHYSFFKYSTHH